jgi:hypothetical protein
MNPRADLPPVTDPFKVVPETIQEVLDREELAQWDLGHRLGYSQSQVARWISGSPIPPLVRHILSCRSCYPHFIRRVALRGPEL